MNNENTLSSIIKPEELMVLKETTAFVLIDVRTGANIKEKFAQSHLAGAKHVDLDSQLAEVPANAADGGRHPLPNILKFEKILAQLGITPNIPVIIYDDKNGANAAARFWWMLRAIGHQKVQVIDGGMGAAIKAGYPLSNQEAISNLQEAKDEENEEIGKGYAQEWQLSMAEIVEVDKATHNAQCLIIDVRESGRYNGEFEPIDLVAGHIPNAINIPFSSNLDTEGFFLSPLELRDKYERILNNRDTKNVIVHCGSGVTACHTLLAMAYAGMDIPKLYVGSWSEWSRSNRPLVTKTENSLN